MACGWLRGAVEVAEVKYVVIQTTEQSMPILAHELCGTHSATVRVYGLICGKQTATL
jgi:hypothetical protein